MDLSRIVDIERDSHSGYPEDSYIARAYRPLSDLIPVWLLSLFPKYLYRELTSQELDILNETDL